MLRGPKRVQEAAKRSLGLDLGRFWRGFGEDLGGQNNKKIEILVFFGYAFRCFNFGRFLHFGQRVPPNFKGTFSSRNQKKSVNKKRRANIKFDRIRIDFDCF